MTLSNVKEELNSQTMRWKAQGLRMSVSMPSLMKRINRRSEEEDRKRPVFMRFRDKSKPANHLTPLPALPSEHSDSSSSSESLSEKVEVDKLLPRLREYNDIGIRQRGSLPNSSNVSRLEAGTDEQRSGRALLVIRDAHLSAELKEKLMDLGVESADDARNAEEAMGMCRNLARQQAIYLVIFVDLSTPAVNGHDFVRNIRHNERITHIRRSFICGIGSEIPLDLLDTAIPSLPCDFDLLRSILQQANSFSV